MGVCLAHQGSGSSSSPSTLPCVHLLVRYHVLSSSTCNCRLSPGISQGMLLGRGGPYGDVKAYSHRHLGRALALPPPRPVHRPPLVCPVHVIQVHCRTPLVFRPAHPRSTKKPHPLISHPSGTGQASSRMHTPNFPGHQRAFCTNRLQTRPPPRHSPLVAPLWPPALRAPAAGRHGRARAPPATLPTGALAAIEPILRPLLLQRRPPRGARGAPPALLPPYQRAGPGELAAGDTNQGAYHNSTTSCEQKPLTCWRWSPSPVGGCPSP
jgi:hypothetical protein